VSGNLVTSGGNVYFAIHGPQADLNFTPPNTAYWQRPLQVVMLLEIADAQNPAKSEVVSVTGVAPAGSFTANFPQSYTAGSTIVCRGNPGPRTTYNAVGPQTMYNPHDDRTVVLHMSVIK